MTSNIDTIDMSDNAKNDVNRRTTHECRYHHVKPAALDALAEIVDRLRRTDVPGCFDAQDNWFRSLAFPSPYVSAVTQ